MRKMVCSRKGKIYNSIIFLLIFSLNLYAVNKKPEISVVTDKAPGVVVLHGLSKLTDALDSKNITFEKVQSIDEASGKLIIVTGLAYGEGATSRILKAGNRNVPEVSESLTIWKTNWKKKPVWVISGFDDRGVMYGLLDVADRIGWSHGRKPFMGEIKEITGQPALSERAISIYTMNRAYWESRFYDEAYWTHYLDLLAKDRFNSLMIIFGYENGGFLAPPYPYFFNVDGYPDVSMVGLTAGEQQRNLEALNHLIEMAHGRGIKVSVAIWDHIYRGGVQSGGMAGLETAPDKPIKGMVWGLNGDNLIAYTKAALERMVRMVPGLDGIEFRMHSESGLKRGEQEAFWTDVFHSVKSVAPGMQFVLRAKDMPESVIQAALKEGINFKIETKYWMEQMGLPFHPTHINTENQYDRRQGYADMLRYPQDYKMYWRLWTGGTTRILLWGDPDYARRFVESAKLYNGDAYEVNEPLATKMESQPHDARSFDLLNPRYRYYDYEFERYWHFFQVFGRMGYNPDQSPDIWHKEFELRFGKKAAPLVETALHQASWILPRIVASCYPYSCFPTTRGWAEKQRLGDLPQYARAEGSDIQLFADFGEEARMLIEGGETAKILPSMTSRWFEQTSSDIDKLITKAENAIGKKQNKEFNSTITDLKILSGLALFHSRRIPAAVSYRLFERTNDISALDDAIGYERNAIEAWRQIVAAAGDVYADDLMMGVREAEFQGINHHLSGHWKDELGYLEQGLAALEQQRKNFKPEGTVTVAPKYKIAANTDNGHLFQVSLLPVSSAPVDMPLTIRANVSAPAGVKWVRLRYRSVNQKEDYKSMDMLRAGDKNLFEATVPAEQINTKWDLMYLIEVMDNNGNGKMFPDMNKETPYLIVKLIR
ncbi:MAG: hypothetical protein WCE64_15000 [Bacteroidales bacterium]